MARSCSLAADAAGADAGELPAERYVALRGLARSWLSSTVAAWRASNETDAETRRRGRRALERLQQAAGLRPVRDETALAALDQRERDSWRQLWREVEEARSQLAQ